MSDKFDDTKPTHYNNLNTVSQDVAAFIAAIAGNPEDDTARLVFADWIDEHIGDHELADWYRFGAKKWMEEFVAGEQTSTNWSAAGTSGSYCPDTRQYIEPVVDIEWKPVTVKDAIQAGHDYLDSEGEDYFTQFGEEGLRDRMYEDGVMDTWWRAFEVLTGRVVDRHAAWAKWGMSPFSCSC